LAVVIIFSFISAFNLHAQTYVTNETELDNAISSMYTDIAIATDTLNINSTITVAFSPDLYIHAASTPAFFSGGANSSFDIIMSSVTFKDIGFKNLSSGAFLIAGNSNMTFENTAIENNDSSNDFAAFVFADSEVAFNGDIKASSNTGTYLGGVFSFENSTVTFNGNAEFSHNSAYSGSAIWAEFRGNSIIFNGKSNFDHNNSILSGGAVKINGSNLNFNDEADFRYNQSAADGGAVHIGANTFVNFDSRSVFEGNKAADNGGAMYIAENYLGGVNFSARASFMGNESGKSGGAIYLNESVITLQNASFTNNTAGENGGAIFLKGNAGYNSELNINTVNNGASNNKTVFQGNTAAGKSNAIYLGEYSIAAFDTAYGASVEMYDGIASSTRNTFMIVKGVGDFNLYAEANIDNLEIDAGVFNIKSSNNLTAGTLAANQSAVINMQNSSNSNAITVKNFDFDGLLKIDGGAGDGSDGDKIVAENAKLGLNSRLNIKTDADVDASMDYRKRYYKILNYAVLTGTFSNVTVNNNLTLASVSRANEILYADNWMTVTLSGNKLYTDFTSLTGLSYNQQQVAKTFDRLSGSSSLSLDLDERISAIDAYADDNLKKDALFDASGYFIANVIRSAALGSCRYDIYNRLRYHDIDAHNLNGIWVQAKAQNSQIEEDENSRNRYKDFGLGALAGWDIMLDDYGLALGVYGKYDKHDIKQDNKNEAVIESFALGVYGGILKDEWEIKTLISASADNFNTARYISFADRKAEADFSAFTVGFDFEAAIRSYVTESVLFRPFAGIEVKNTGYDSFEEKKAGDLSLKVDGDDYSRSAARIGLGISSDDGEITEWYANVEGKYLLSRDAPEIMSVFMTTSDKFVSRGAKEGTTIIGFGAGGAYKISERFKVFANASYQYAEGYQNLYGNMGLRYMLAGSGK